MTAGRLHARPRFRHRTRGPRGRHRAPSRQVRNEKRNDVQTVMGLATGTRLGVYEIVGSIGAGGMGEVYRARDSRLGRDVAVKVLPEVLATDPTALARFEREMKTLAALSNPYIVAIYDVGK